MSLGRIEEHGCKWAYTDKLRRRNTNPNTSLIKIEGVDDRKAASFYLGKRIAYVYRGKREIRGTKIRVIWGKVTRTHGT